MKKNLSKLRLRTLPRAVLCAALSLSAVPPALGQDIYSTGDSADWASQIHEVTVTGEAIEIGEASAWNKGVFHIGTEDTRSVSINKLGLSESSADITGSSISIAQVTGSWASSITAKAGSGITLGSSSATSGQQLVAGGSSSAISLTSGGALDSFMSFSAQNGSAESPAQLTLSADGDITQTLGQSSGSDGFSAIQSGSIEATSENGSIRTNRGILAANSASVTLFARSGEVDLSSGSIAIVGGNPGQSSSVTVEARSLSLENGSVTVNASLGNYWSPVKPDKKTAFTFKGGSFSAQTVFGVGSTVTIDASDSVTLNEPAGYSKAVYGLDSDLSIGSDTAAVIINGSIATHSADGVTSTTQIKGASIGIDARAGSKALMIAVQGSGSKLEIGGKDSEVSLAGRIYGDSGTILIDGKTITAEHGAEGTWQAPEAVRVMQGGHVSIGHDTTETVSLSGQLLTSGSSWEGKASALEVSGQRITVSRTTPENSSFQDPTVASTLSDTVRLGNLSSEAETQSLSIEGEVKAYGGSIALYGDEITVNGAADRTLGAYSRLSLAAPSGHITAGDSRTSSITLNGSVIGSAGRIEVYGGSIRILADKSETALMAGGGSGSFSGDITVGDTDSTRSIQIEGEVVAASRPVTLRSGGTISISSDTDYAVETLSGSASIGTDETGSVTIDQAVIARGAALEIRGGDISLSTEKQPWAAAAGGAAVQLGSDATGSLQVKSGLLADGSTVSALGRSIQIKAASSGGTAGQSNGSTLTIGDESTESASVLGSLQTYGGSLEVQGAAITLSADGADQALLARGGAINAGTEGAGTSLSVTGHVLALGAPIRLGSAQRALTTVSGELEARGGAISVQGGTIALAASGEDYAAYTNGSAIDIGTDGAKQITIEGEARAENGALRIGSEKTGSAAVTGQAHALGSDITIEAAAVSLTASGSEPAGLAENGSALRAGVESAGLVSIAGTALARTGGLIEIGGEASGAQVTGSLEAETGGSVNAHFNTEGSLLYGSILSQGEGSKVTAEFHGGKLEGSVQALDSGTVNLDFRGSSALLEGSLEAHRNGTLQASFAEGAVFTGRAATTYSSTASNLSFTSGARWNVTGDSNVTTLTVDDNAAVSLRGAATTLTVDQAQRGSGALFALDLDPSNRNRRAPSAQSDYLYFNGSTEGVQRVDFDTANLRTLGEGDKLYFASTADSGLSFVSERNLTNLTREGALYDYSYALGSESSGQGRDWFLQMTGRRDNGSAGILEGYGVAGYLLVSEMDRLNKREGEAARSPEGESGLWVRTRYSRATVSGVRNKYGLLQIGADVERATQNGRATLGFAFDYTDDSLAFRRGSGHAYRYGVSFYDTWRTASGWYTDAVLRVGVISNKMKGASEDGQSLATRFHNSFGSASLEAGRRLELQGGFFLEPQAQFQVSVIDGASYTTRSGVKGDEDSVVSAAGRVGFRAGRSLGANRSGSLYLKADALHEFAGDRAVRATSADGLESIRRSSDGSATWYDAGLGANVNLGRRTFLWADAEGIFGGGYGSAWQVNAGVRWKF